MQTETGEGGASRNSKPQFKIKNPKNNNEKKGTCFSPQIEGKYTQHFRHGTQAQDDMFVKARALALMANPVTEWPSSAGSSSSSSSSSTSGAALSLVPC
jgi:hypothetical protein